jgi:hypothetical protein
MRLRFRETLWFKKGEQDAEVAHKQVAGETGRIAIDTLPVEDRYLDDGSVRREDSQLFGLHTGTTQAIEPVGVPKGDDDGARGDGGGDGDGDDDVPGEAGAVEGALIAEMKRGRRVVFAMLAGAVLALGGIVMTLV